MSKNPILKEHILDSYDKDKNYNFIYSQIQKKKNLRKIILNSVASIFAIVVMGSIGTSIYAKRAWDIEYREYQNRNVYSTKTAITDAINTNYIENLNMEYIYKDGIGIKIDSLMITDDHFQMTVNLQIEDFSKIDSDSFEFGYAIYDEKNNIYDISERNTFGIKKWQYKKSLARELNLEYNENRGIPKNIATSSGKETILSQNGNIIVNVNLNSYEEFPKSKKLFIRIYNIGFTLVDGYTEKNNEFIITDSEDFELSNSEWQFEITIPEKFHNRNIIELKSDEVIEGFEIAKANLSETGLILNLKHIYPLINMGPNSINISDENGNIYPQRGGISDDYIIKQVFDINKNDLDKGIYVNLNIPEININKRIKLIEK